MARIPRPDVRSVTQPVLRRWDRVPMRTQGRITVALPIVAVIVSAVFALVGNTQRVDIETDIQRKFEMTSALNNLTTLMVNAETGMRGYLLTGQSGFLQPFDQASAQLPSAISRLNGLAAAEPGEKPRADKLARVEQMRVLSGEQMSDLSRQRGYVSSGRLTVSDSELRDHLAYGKSLMDQIRTQVDAMHDEEQELLTERIADINAIRVRDYFSVALALLVALVTRFVAWYLFRNGTLRRVDRLTDTVRIIRDGGPVPGPPPTKRDRMGELEREVHLLGGGATPDSDPRAADTEPTGSRT